MRTPILALPLLALAARTDRPLQTTADGTTGSSATDTSAAPTTTDPTATTDPTSTTGTTGITGADDTTSVDTTSTATTTPDGPPSTCGPPCDASWEHFDNLNVADGVDYACLTRVHGDLSVAGPLGPETLASLANIRQVDGFVQIDTQPLTDLAPFACLEQIGGIVLIDMPQLTDLSALGNLHSAGSFGLNGTGVAALPKLADDFTGLYNLWLNDNPALTDLSAASTWGTADDQVKITLTANPGLTALTGLAGLVDGPAVKVITIKDMPALTSLTGLEPLDLAALDLRNLPALPKLDALGQLKTSYRISLSDLPKVSDLSGLANLETAAELMLGDCADMSAPGLAGLTSLAGLDSLTDLGALGLANNVNLESLDGAPKLTSIVQGFTAVNNPALTQKAYDALLSQLAAPPLEDCLGDWNSCDCFQIMPW